MKHANWAMSRVVGFGSVNLAFSVVAGTMTWTSHWHAAALDAMLADMRAKVAAWNAKAAK